MVSAGVTVAILGLMTNGIAQMGRLERMRLIDADALLKNIRRAVYPSDMTTTIAVGICQSHVKDMPTVDAELVVRCKRCKQWDNSSEGQYVGGWCFCDRLQMSTSPDWFCADGEAKHEQTD